MDILSKEHVRALIAYDINAFVLKPDGTVYYTGEHRLHKQLSAADAIHHWMRDGSPHLVAIWIELLRSYATAEATYSNILSYLNTLIPADMGCPYGEDGDYDDIDPSTLSNDQLTAAVIFMPLNTLSSVGEGITIESCMAGGSEVLEEWQARCPVSYTDMFAAVITQIDRAREMYDVFTNMLVVECDLVDPLYRVEIFNHPPGTMAAPATESVHVHYIRPGDALPAMPGKRVHGVLATSVIHVYNTMVSRTQDPQLPMHAYVYSWNDHDGYVLRDANVMVTIERISRFALLGTT